MTTKLIENCLEQEYQEEQEFTRYITLGLKRGVTLLVFDPYMINMEDLIHAKPGHIALIRIRKPGWGIGDIHRYIHMINI